jgi:hypothetical protein
MIATHEHERRHARNTSLHAADVMDPCVLANGEEEETSEISRETRRSTEAAEHAGSFSHLYPLLLMLCARLRSAKSRGLEDKRHERDRADDPRAD